MDFRSQQRASGGGGILYEICPQPVATYIQLNLNTMSKIINHILIITLGCNIFLWIHCFNPSPEAEKVSMGYNIAFISFLLLVQSIILWIILNNTNNRFGMSVASCTPNEFTVGVCLGLCIGGTVIAYIMSRSFHTASQQCTAFDSIKKPVTRYLAETIISTATNTTNTTTNTTPNTVPAPAPSPTATSHTNTSPTTPNFEHDPILQYICSKVFQRILRSRMFWSLWIFRLNLITSVLIAVARPELTSNQQHQQQQSYMGVPTVDDSTNTSRTRIGSQQPYNNPPTGSSVFAATVARMPAFVGDYATIPEVRTPSVAPVVSSTPTSNGNGNYSSSSLSSATSTNKNSESANILSV